MLVKIESQKNTHVFFNGDTIAIPIYTVQFMLVHVCTCTLHTSKLMLHVSAFSGDFDWDQWPEDEQSSQYRSQTSLDSVGVSTNTMKASVNTWCITCMTTEIMHIYILVECLTLMASGAIQLCQILLNMKPSLNEQFVIVREQIKLFLPNAITHVKKGMG